MSDGAAIQPLKRPKPTRRLKLRKRGPGKPFSKGANSHNGEVHRRGIDLIPRGSMTLLHQMLLDDDGTLAVALEREAKMVDTPARAFRVRYALALLKGLRQPTVALRIGAEIADRLEGRPVQTVKQQRTHTTIFYDTSQPLPPALVGQGETAGSAAVPSTPEPTIVATRMPEDVRAIAQAGEGNGV